MAMNNKTTLTIALGLVIASGSLVGCVSTPEIDRTKRRPHTAMRGPAYKRLIVTYNEANNLAYRADRYAKAMRDSDAVDPDTQLRAMELADDVAKFADDIEWSLANNQRMIWHRQEMNGYWDRFVELYPDDEVFAEVLTSSEMRKTTWKLQMKNQAEYADLHEYERAKPRWGDLFKMKAEKVYKQQVEKQD